MSLLPADPSDALAASPPATHSGGEYVVVARRYRPQTFTDLVGQEHVAQALVGAIQSQRVGHAYLFTGARGVGKTSAARILAKALNCFEGPTSTPCNRCDVCLSVASGDDVDVLEIDGASNRGIDEIRELRQTVNVRPSRARFKVYIIDEVHMLTREAFNALLKTLEEPPEHVKFIFCTTEAEKIPITILSRCQRFDFAGIQPREIVHRLRQIVAAEGVQAEEEALELLARRAAGSMRDSQSLLEQLLACGQGSITVAELHRLLGTAGEERLSTLADKILERDPAGALTTLDEAIQEGVDVGQLLDQLLGWYRDVMVVAVGGKADALLYISPPGFAAAQRAAQHWGVETVLAAMQLLDATLARLRVSAHARTLAELAIVRLCKLEDLTWIGSLIDTLRTEGEAGSAQVAPRGNLPPVKKNVERPSLAAALTESTANSATSLPASSDVRAATPSRPLIEPIASNARAIWEAVLDRLGEGLPRERASMAESIAISAPNRLAVQFRERYTLAKSTCERPEIRAALERALAEVAGCNLKLHLELLPDLPSEPTPSAPVVDPRDHLQRMFEKAQNPFARRAIELFQARPVRLES